jgi:surface carbohydrate biosynthesis protein (TIGR04326 family)
MLHEEGWHTNWIQHFMFSNIVPDTKTGLDWLGRFNRDKERQGSHSFLDSCLSWQVVLRVLSKWFKLNIVSWKLGGLESALDGSKLYLWPLLKNDWLSSLTGQTAVTNLLWWELFDAALRDMPRQKLGFYLYEEMGWERAFLHAWRKNGHGRIVGVSHTTVPFWHMNYFHDPRSLRSDAAHPMPQPDLIAVNGLAMKSSLGNSGYPESTLVDVEALRYLHFEDIDRKKRSTDGGILRIIVLGDIIPSATRIMLGLVEAALKLIGKECLVTFKPHPATYIPASDFPDLEAEETNKSLGELLNDFDIAVSAYSSSSALDAYMAGLSVIVYWDGGDFNLSPLRGMEDVRFVGTVEEMAGALCAQHAEIPPSSEEFFFFGRSLPRWRSIVADSMGKSPLFRPI